MMAALNLPVMRLSTLLQDLTVLPTGMDCTVTGLAIDSRLVKSGDVFLAYAGTHEDGARYVREAAAAGACAVLMESADLLPQLDVPVLGLRDLRTHVGLIASRFYQFPAHGMTLVAVTGTNGKTSVAHLCAQAWRTLHGSSGYFGTLGYGALEALEAGPNTTPDPVTLQRNLARLAAAGTRHVALEASSHALSQGRLDHLAIAVAVFTGLGHDHLDYHGTLAAYGAAKQRLFQHPGLAVAILNLDDAYAVQVRAALASTVRLYTYSTDPQGPSADVHALAVTTARAGLVLRVRTWQGEVSLTSPLIGDFNAQNLLAALTVLMVAGSPCDAAAAALSQADPIRGRMELIAGPPGSPLVYVDYAHSPDSLARVLRALRTPDTARLICVFGCGGDRDHSKRGPMGALAESLADHTILTSDNPRSEDPQAIAAQIKAGMRQPALALFVPDRAAAIAHAIALASAQDVVLIAGKGHESTQITGRCVRPFDDAALARSLLMARTHD
ncbi:MAG: UDP-N-acetylmuramoyl-L-alanyl-D-glutamate--2,6-diaminopimelate ligase [Gammaproteobacteria bacterium]|nr:UDP-N-acetylmuramoyl-L-alanyl-D-glutamate--2,6-diaminopimelate ligase [Gammaproteobacteria bacterium]